MIWQLLALVVVFSASVCSADVTPANSNIVHKNGSSANLIWNMNLNNYSVIAVRIEQEQKGNFVSVAGLIYGKKLINVFIPSFKTRLSLNRATYKIFSVKIDKLQFTDAGNYRLVVTLDSANILRSEKLNLEVKGGPVSCGSFSLPSPYIVVGNTPYVLKVSLCGYPQPTVKWYVGSIEDMSGSSNTTGDANITEFIYEKRVAKYTTNLCGKTVGYKATGAYAPIENSVTIDLMFIPDMVTGISSNRAKQVDQITTTWDFKMNTGLCKVQYEINYFDGSNITIDTAQTTNSEKSFTQTFDDQEQRDSVKYVRVRTTYKSKNSNWTDRIQVSFDPPTTTAATTASKATPSPRSGDDNMGVIIGVVVGIIFIIIIIVIVVYIMKKKKNERKPRDRYDEMDLASRNVRTANENDYAAPEHMVPSKQASGREDARRHDNPDQMVYAELGAGGGRTGPRPAPAQSNYAEVKLDGMGYPAEGPSSRKSTQPPTYAVVDKMRRHSLPPSDNEDDYSGVVV